jgi:hypothetical protein
VLLSVGQISGKANLRVSPASSPFRLGEYWSQTDTRRFRGFVTPIADSKGIHVLPRKQLMYTVRVYIPARASMNNGGKPDQVSEAGRGSNRYDGDAARSSGQHQYSRQY